MARQLIDGMTQDEAREKIYEIAERNGYRSRTDAWIEISGGQHWPEMSDDDFRWIVEKLLPRHSYYEIKRGSGIVEIIFGTNSRYPAKRSSRPAACMYGKRSDGTLTDISWRECLKPANKRFKVRNAMRWAIRPQIVEFRNRCFAKCSICDSTVRDDLIDIDHYPKRFEEIATAWMESVSLTDETIETNGDKDFEVGDKFVDVELERQWQDYHRYEASYRVLCHKCHRKLPR